MTDRKQALEALLEKVEARECASWDECETCGLLRGILNDIEMLTATGEGLDPDECIRIHIMANVRT